MRKPRWNNSLTIVRKLESTIDLIKQRIQDYKNLISISAYPELWMSLLESEEQMLKSYEIKLKKAKGIE